MARYALVAAIMLAGTPALSEEMFPGCALDHLELNALRCTTTFPLPSAFLPAQCMIEQSCAAMSELVNGRFQYELFAASDPVAASHVKEFSWQDGAGDNPAKN